MDVFSYGPDEDDAVAEAVFELLRLAGSATAADPAEVDQKAAAEAALAQKTAQISSLERELGQLRIKLQSQNDVDDAADIDRSAQLVQEREARVPVADTLRAIGGPFNAPSYELEIIGEHRRVQLIPIVDGKLGAAIEQKLVPAPRAYDLVVTARDINNLPIRARLTPTKFH